MLGGWWEADFQVIESGRDLKHLDSNSNLFSNHVVDSASAIILLSNLNAIQTICGDWQGFRVSQVYD